jgi:septum formation inhibitor MinC
MTSNQGKAGLKVSISRDKLTAWIFTSEVDAVLGREAINSELSKAGVVFGVLAEEMTNFLVAPSKEPQVIARGVPPTPGTDERVELLFPNELTHDSPDEMDTVDFREISTVVSVDEGILLAKKYPGSSGSEGMGVTGEVLLPPKPRTVNLQAGKGAVLSDGGDEVYAAISGRPWLKVAGPSRIVGCEAVFVQNGDVDIKTGNLRFKGDIRITGNVQEAMEVQTTGNIEIMGFVTRASVISGSKMIIRGNVTGSRVRSGIVFPGANKVNFMLMDIYTELMNLGKSYEQLKSRQDIDIQKMDFGRVLLGLMDSRFKNLRPLLKNINSFAEVQGENLPGEIIAAVESLKCLSGLSCASYENFNKAVKAVATSLEILSQNTGQSGSAVFIRSAMASTIQSAGNVNITGQGCVNSTINAGGNVIVKGSFKGGEILCEGYADMQELGSELGMPPIIRVGERSYIKVEKAYPGTVVQVGKVKITLTKIMNSFKAKLNRDGQLELL